MQRILVTGGSGFLGRYIVKYLENHSYEAFAPRSSEFDLITGQGVREYMESVKLIDAIIHSAAYYGGIGINQAEPATIFHKNVQMTLSVFELAREYRVQKLLPIGSACAYPGHLQGDLKESDFWQGPLHDSVEAYGFTKKLQLVAQKAYFKQHGIESNHLILTNLYGPYDVFTEYRSHVVSALIKKFVDARLAGKSSVVLWGDGSPIREFMYVEDAAEAIVKTLPLAHDLEPINIGTGVDTSIRHLAELTKRISNYKGEIAWDTSKPNGTKRKVLDVHRMKMMLQWYPEWSIEKGLRETIQWYQFNKEEADHRC